MEEEIVIIESPTVEGCKDHLDEKPTLCCTDHGIKCCKVCSEEDQRAYKQTSTISQTINESRCSKEFETFQEDMKTVRRKYEATRISVQEEIKKVVKTKRHVIKDIGRYKRELVSRLEELEEQSIDMVNERCKQITRKMEAIADQIDRYLSQIDETLTQTEFDSETKSKGRKEKVKTLRDDLSKIVTNVDGFEGISISLNKDIKTFFDKTKGLAKVNLPCQTKLKGNINIQFDSDFETCGISDICTLPDGTVVLTDLSNDCIKRLDESYGNKDLMQLKGGPLGICPTKPGEMAVTLRESQTVQFLNYTETSMMLMKSFPTNCSCNYICCMDNALFITCEGGNDDNGQGHIRKYDMTGNLLCAIETDDMGRRLFTTPLHITANEDETKLFVTDMGSKVIIIDKTGKKLNQYKSTSLTSAFGISALPDQNILVSSVDSHNVQQIDDRCRFVGTVLSKVNGLENPVCIAYNGSRSQIIVSMDDADELLVFDVSFP
ncbi:uncharacterized protein LOC123531383 [Mercenaria mercenaria]|uniref:uncharacterized protein LOC123531383 n=1 Tax=Mercenaria mercenaria TaxID=6596 RepID=UPI00234E63CE|nr:uncharacterized protein LOC123531383 [Mercenaria mercenaria]